MPIARAPFTHDDDGGILASSLPHSPLPVATMALAVAMSSAAYSVDMVGVAWRGGGLLYGGVLGWE